MSRWLSYVLFLMLITNALLGYSKLGSVTAVPQAVTYSEPQVRLYAFSPTQTSNPVQVTQRQHDHLSIRLVILKHAREQMAHDDANLATQAAQKAAAKGLKIKVIGNENIDGVAGLQAALKKYVKMQAEDGDTLIVHTIGHGAPNGGLVTLGQRSEVMKAMADAAGQNHQEILWWQLSCFAAANLPSISSLSQDQQGQFSIVASSTASQESPTREQARIMEKVFMAMAEMGQNIDPNGDKIITAAELAGFLNTIDNRKRGDLLFAKSPNEVLFGQSVLVRLIPIVDRNGPQHQFPRDYIPVPSQH